MNFKFLFNSNYTDNKLRLAVDDESNSPSSFVWKSADGTNLSNFDWKYLTDLSAAKNSKNLHKLLKDLGLGDRADSLGLVAEYLQSLPTKSVKKEDRKWMNSKRGLYGYTLDSAGNRDYHKKDNPFLRALTTISLSALGPTGAFAGYLLSLPKTPAGLKNGFYNPNLSASNINSNLSWQDGNRSYAKKGNIISWSQPWGLGATLLGVVTTDGLYTLGYTNSTGNPITSITADSQVFENKDGLWVYTDNLGLEHILTYDAASGKFLVDGQDLTNNEVLLLKTGGIMLKFKQGGDPMYYQKSLDDVKEKILLAATYGVIGYTESLGNALNLEDAVMLVLSIAELDPKLIEQIVLNSELVEAGAKSLLSKDPETFKLLQQPGGMRLYVTNIMNKKQTQLKLKKTKAMNGTKLNYIKELKGICPEGYELLYFAAGGNICNRCVKAKKVEEAKCGKKMKAKKHSEGGISDTMNEIKNEVSNSNQKPLKNKLTTPVNDGRKKNNLPTSPKTYDAKKHKQLINDFKKNSYSYKGWPVAKKDSLMKYNELLSSDEDGDWHF